MAPARACMLAGAEFFVTPSLRVSTIEMVKRYSKVICPGALTPTEVLTAWEAGADVVKIFPCGNVGGPKYIKALKGPFPQIEMIPTGGVNLETAGDFLKAGACAVAVGGELVDAKSIKEGRFDVIEDRARQYLAAIAKARSRNTSPRVSWASCTRVTQSMAFLSKGGTEELYSGVTTSTP